MLFNSFSFMFGFLPLVLVGSVVLKKTAGARAVQAWVLLASLVFYAWSVPADLIYLFASIAFNWLIARAMLRIEGPARKRLLVLGLVINVAYLCVFKYLGFLASMAAPVLPHDFRMPQMALPLGISFFTLTQIMYLVDCYEGLVDAGSFFDHASFVAFFPYLISGPLGRAKRMRHQFPHLGAEDGDRENLLSRGIFHFSMGLVKKAAFSTAFAQVVSWGHGIDHPSTAEAWIFSVAYMMELYFDFSGYSDMAIGSAMMLGVEIPRNFDRPFGATSIIEFWQRWHISLTQFITTYLYTPILRSFRKRNLFTASVATFCAMTIAGFWHGAAWSFILYGMLHGIYLTINQVWRKKKLLTLPPLIGWAFTFTAVNIADIFFSAASVRSGFHQTFALFHLHNVFSLNDLTDLTVDSYPFRLSALPLLAAALLAMLGPSSEQLARDFQPTGRNCASTVGLLLVGFLFANSALPSPFIYFRF